MLALQRRGALPLVAAWIVGACSDPVGGVVGLDEGRPDPLVPPPPPANGSPIPDVPAPISPAEVDLGCPEGWFESDAFEPPVRCHPWPTPRPATCSAWAAHFVGEPSCAPVGTACSADELPSDLPSDAPVVHVQQGAAGGDGSRDTPFGTIAEALDQAPPDALIAIGTGVYHEELVVRSGVTLFGACPSQTVLTSAEPSSLEGVVTVAGTEVVIRNLRFDGSSRPAVVVAPDADARLEDVVIERVMGTAVAVVGGRLAARTLLVRDGVHRADSAQGVAVRDDGALELERAVFSGNEGNAIIASGDGTELRLTDIHVQDTRGFDKADASADRSRVDGRSVVVELGASAELRSFVSEDAEDRGLLLRSDATARIEDAVVMGGGLGIEIEGRASGGLSRVRLEQTRVNGLRVDRFDSYARVEDLLVRDTVSEADGDHGRGIHVRSAAMDGFRIRVERSHTSGLKVTEDAMVHVEDVTIVDVSGRDGTGEKGYGLAVDLNSEATVARVAIERNRGAGFLVGPLGTATVEDLLVRGTESQSALGTGGHGVHVTFGSSVDVDRALIEDNREAGISVYGADATGTFRDVAIRNTRGRALDGEFGSGVSVLAAAVELDNAVVADNRHVGVHAGSGGAVSLRRVAVLDTTAQDCVANGTCTDRPFGIGVGAYQQASIEARDFSVARSLLCGIQLAAEGSVRLHDGEVASSLIGACVQVEGFDMAGLTDLVVYRNNVRNLQSTSMPIPELAPPPVLAL